jgi:ADP-ribosylglycohydrolase
MHEDKSTVPKEPSGPTLSDRFQGCLLGGAVGDALGAPIEFMGVSEIAGRFGEQGIRDYVTAYGRLGAFTDDTQMTLFTAEGILRSWTRRCLLGEDRWSIGIVSNAYQRWLETQGYASQSPRLSEPGWLISHKELFSSRAPGNTCLSALHAPKRGLAQNDSKGCGGVMRAAPIGLMMSHWVDEESGCLERIFEMGADTAAITHGHPTGYLTAGMFAVLIALLARGESLRQALVPAKVELRKHRGHQETLEAIEMAEALSTENSSSHAAIERLGTGWIAEEAIAISIYCALRAVDFENGVVLAVNHGGDSDSTGSIAGNLLGCAYGVSQIPEKWLSPLELRGLITRLADDILDARNWPNSQFADPVLRRDLLDRYPPN